MAFIVVTITRSAPLLEWRMSCGRIGRTVASVRDVMFLTSLSLQVFEHVANNKATAINRKDWNSRNRNRSFGRCKTCPSMWTWSTASHCLAPPRQMRSGAVNRTTYEESMLKFVPQMGLRCFANVDEESNGIRFANVSISRKWKWNQEVIMKSL